MTENTRFNDPRVKEYLAEQDTQGAQEAKLNTKQTNAEIRANIKETKDQELLQQKIENIDWDSPETQIILKALSALNAKTDHLKSRGQTRWNDPRAIAYDEQQIDMVLDVSKINREKVLMKTSEEIEDYEMGDVEPYSLETPKVIGMKKSRISPDTSEESIKILQELDNQDAWKIHKRSNEKTTAWINNVLRQDAKQGQKRTALIEKITSCPISLYVLSCLITQTTSDAVTVVSPVRKSETTNYRPEAQVKGTTSPKNSDKTPKNTTFESEKPIQTIKPILGAAAQRLISSPYSMRW